MGGQSNSTLVLRESWDARSHSVSTRHNPLPADDASLRQIKLCSSSDGDCARGKRHSHSYLLSSRSPQLGAPRLTVGNILLTDDNKVLMGLRADCDLWEFPGGKVEDETLVEAAIREMSEESGVILKGAPETLCYADVNITEGRFFLIFLIWKEWENYPQRMEPNKCLEWKWISIADINPEKCTKGSKQALAHLKARVYVEAEQILL